MLDQIKQIITKNNEDNNVVELLAPFGRHYENANSYIIAQLLRINKHRFLKLFLEYINCQFTEQDLDVAKIYTEYELTDTRRRIDIFIELRDSCVVIENKIDAYDQARQLHDYCEFTEKTYKDNVYVVYLTKYGSSPSLMSDENSETGSILQSKIDQLQLTGRFVQLSYKKDILKLLKNMYGALKYSNDLNAPNDNLIKSAIEQYIFSIINLTSNTQEELINYVKASYKTIELAQLEELLNADIPELYTFSVLPLLKAIHVYKTFEKTEDVRYAYTYGYFQVKKLRMLDMLTPNLEEWNDNFDNLLDVAPYFVGVEFVDKDIKIIFLNDNYKQFQIHKSGIFVQGYDTSYLKKLKELL